VVAGCVSNMLPPARGAPSSSSGAGSGAADGDGGGGGGGGGSLFLVDAHCYPGMEGAPLTCE
jgi:hypothetical protein